MEALVFLMRATLKNHLLEMRKKPGIMLLYGFVILAILSSLRMAASIDPEAMAAMRLDNATELLRAGAFILILMFMGSFISKGLDTGGSFFSMADVNLLFTSPLNATHILAYGMVKQAATTLLGGVVLLAQATNLRNFFGIGGRGTLALFVGYVLSMVAAEGLAMLIYGLTNGNPRRKIIVVALCAAVVLPLCVMLLTSVTQGGIMAGVAAVGGSFYATLIPIAGWTAGGADAFIRGDFLAGLFFYGLDAVFFAAAIWIFTRHGSDYYEDVIAATQTSATVKAAQASGDVREASALRRRVKVGSTGLFGKGAAAIMSRQLREGFRLNPLKLIDTYSLSVIAMGGVMAFVNRAVGGTGALISSFFTVTYMQMAFMTITGPLKELTTHYIFLIPEHPVKKLLWNNGSAILKAACESVLTYLLIGFILKLQPVTVVAAMFVSLCFSIMLFSLNVWGLRFFGAVINRGIMLIVYLLMTIVVMLPGLITAGVMVFQNPLLMETLVFPALLLGGWCLLVTLAFTYWSRNVLHNIDMITIQVRK